MPAYTGAIVMRDSIFTIEATDFANQVTNVQLVPDTPIQTLRTLVPDGVIQDVDSTAWTLQISAVQSWETGGLANILHANVGTAVTVTFAPKKGVGKKLFTFDVIAVDPPVGGEAGSFAILELELPVVGGITVGTVPS